MDKRETMYNQATSLDEFCDPEVFAEATPAVTIQFIYEYQLSALLSRDYYS